MYYDYNDNDNDDDNNNDNNDNNNNNRLPPPNLEEIGARLVREVASARYAEKRRGAPPVGVCGYPLL